jgi:hypothetical protein
MYETNITSSSLLARKMKVRTLQYKATIFFVAFLLFAFRPQLTATYQWYLWAKQWYQNTIDVHQRTKVQHATVLKDAELLQQISNWAQKNSLIQCYNSNCTSLPESIKNEPEKSAVKAYLQLQKAADNTKFTLDQKKLLAYLNEFLVKSSTELNKINGTISDISFGWAGKTIPNAISVPTTITISFSDKQWLFWFLRNVEQYISPTFPMLTIVNTINYDIINSDTAQNVTIGLNIYMLD